MDVCVGNAACTRVSQVLCAWDGWCVLFRRCVCVRSLSSVELCDVLSSDGDCEAICGVDPHRCSQALIHGLNRHYYSIGINYRKTDLEEQVRALFCIPLSCFTGSSRSADAAHPAGSSVNMTHTKFVTHMKMLLAATGVPAGDYAGHSLRRGGATFALNLGFPESEVRRLGTWTSNTVHRYHEVSVAARNSLPARMAEAAASTARRPKPS